MNYNPMMQRQGYGPSMAADDGSMRPRPWLQPGFQARTGGPGQMQGAPNVYTGGGMPPMGMPAMHPSTGGGLPPMQGGMTAQTGGGLPPQPMGLPPVQTGGGLPPQGLARMGGASRGMGNNRLLGYGLMR